MPSNPTTWAASSRLGYRRMLSSTKPSAGSPRLRTASDRVGRQAPLDEDEATARVEPLGDLLRRVSEDGRQAPREGILVVDPRGERVERLRPRRHGERLTVPVEDRAALGLEGMVLACWLSASRAYSSCLTICTNASRATRPAKAQAMKAATTSVRVLTTTRRGSAPFRFLPDCRLRRRSRRSNEAHQAERRVRHRATLVLPAGSRGASGSAAAVSGAREVRPVPTGTNSRASRT